MTTTVIVKCVSSNPGKGAFAYDGNGNNIALSPGDEATFYLHDSNSLIVAEGVIQVAETQQETGSVPPDPSPEDETTG